MADLTRPGDTELLLRGNHIPAGILRSAVKSGRIANAYLLKGPEGAPKYALALVFAKALLCDSGESGVTGDPCDKCWSCRAVSNHGHPDLREIEKDGATIKIKASHEMLKEALARPYHSSRKVFIVKDAEAMTVEASNALLKVLEEPPSYVTFMLTASNIRSIPDTIVSRCQTVPFRKLPSDVLTEALVSYHDVSPDEASSVASQADGDIDRALRILAHGAEGSGDRLLSEIAKGSAIELAHKHARADSSRRLDVITDIEIELAKRFRASASSMGNDDHAAGRLGLGRLFRSLRSTQEARARLRSNVNPFLTFSSLFIDLQRMRQKGD